MVNLLLENFTTLCLIIGLGIIIVLNRNFDKKTNISFIAFIAIIVILVLISVIETDYSKLSKPTYIRFIASAAGYTLRSAAVPVLINILLRRTKSKFILWLPVIFIGIISFTSNSTHLMFWFDKDNTFMRGSLSYIVHVVSIVYMIVLLYLVVKMHKYITSGEVFTLFFSLFVCFFATLIETEYSDFKFLLTGAMAVSCILYYVVIYAETYRRDYLTGLLNRKSLFETAAKMKNKSFTVISVDLNNLKGINDSCGHSAGDKALKNLADALFLNCDKNFYPFRLGGDEFVVLFRGNNTDEVIKYIQKVKSNLKDKRIMASFGYALSEPGNIFDDVCINADKSMYEDKKNYKYQACK